MAISGSAIARATAKANRNRKVKSDLSIPSENFIYFHHINKLIIIPVDPTSIADSMGANFSQSNPLSRSAPIYSYANSGPRTVQVAFKLHRDLCKQFNPDKEDAVESLINWLEAGVLPDYNEVGKIVNPPLVSLKIRDTVYIKGVISGSVGKTFDLPIIDYGSNGHHNFKHALVTINFQVTEVKPFSASIIGKYGPYRT